MSLRTTSGSDGLLEAGLFLVVVASPLVFTPFTAAPFVDPKLLLLTVGTLLVALSRPRADRTMSYGAAGFVAVVALATAFSVDRWWSTISTEARGMGLIGLAASALLLCAGTGLAESLRARLPRWLFWTGVVVSVVAVVARFVSLGTNTFRLDPFSATIGHRAFVGGFLAAAALAAAASSTRVRDMIGLVVLGSGISVTAARGALIGLVVGFAVILVRTRDWRRIALVFMPLLVTVLAWTVVSAIRPPMERNQLGYSGVQRFTELNEGSALERPQAFKAFVRAWRDDPLLGSGPGTAWKPYIMHVRPSEIRVAGRGFADTHNIFLEFAVTTGTLGLLAFLALLGLVLPRLRRAPPERAWALAAALAIGVVLSLEPTTLPLTPLLFLCAGLAVTDASPRRTAQLTRWVAAPLAIALVLVSMDFVGSTLEMFGATYDSRDALRWSSEIAPWRLLTELELAKKRAFDSRETDPTGDEDARAILRAAIDHHAWNPEIRFHAANVELLMDDVAAARRLVAEQLRFFPNDPRAVLASAVLALRAEDWKSAQTFARRSLRIDPTSQPARSIIRKASAHLDGND